MTDSPNRKADPVTQDDFWPAVQGARAGFLAVSGADFAPMAHFADRESHGLWFFTAEGTDLERAAQTGGEATFLVVNEGDNAWAVVHGTAHLHMDRAKLDEFWNPMTDAWFEEGKQDPDLRMIHFRPTRAELWKSDGGAKFMYEIAKAKVTGDTPDPGQHGTLSFSPAA
ncbi:MAG: pyridoxamine 5'-phosphate oxidase family protein [Shimia sp.]